MNRISHKGAQGYFVALLSTDGVEDIDAMLANLQDQHNEDLAAQATDFDSIAADVNAFLSLPENSGLRTIPTGELARALWVASGAATLPRDQANARFDRISEVLPAYIKSKPDQFHMGKRNGIVIRYVDGETVKDQTGKEMLVNGKPVQAKRHSDEEWAKLTTPKSKVA